MPNILKVSFAAVSALCIAACVPVTSATEPAGQVGQSDVAFYRALGTEPFWSLTIAGDQIEFQPMDGESLVASDVTARPSFNGWRYTSDTVSVDVTFAPCSDGMSDTVYKDTVTVLVGTTEFRGCGGGALTPGAALANSAWQITSVNGADIYNPMGRGPLLVRFGKSGLSAATGCNGFGGSYVAGEGWLYAPNLASTLMACDPRLMAQEAAIGAALSGHGPLRAGPEGSMIIGRKGAEIRLSRVGDCPECADMDSPSDLATPLQGDWDIVQINDARVSSDRPYRLTFADNKVAGFAGCNRFFGVTMQQGATIAFGDLGATKMACMGQGGEDENTVWAMMNTQMTVQMVSEDMAYLANALGGLVLIRAR